MIYETLQNTPYPIQPVVGICRLYLTAFIGSYPAIPLVIERIKSSDDQELAAGKIHGPQRSWWLYSTGFLWWTTGPLWTWKPFMAWFKMWKGPRPFMGKQKLLTIKLRSIMKQHSSQVHSQPLIHPYWPLKMLSIIKTWLTISCCTLLGIGLIIIGSCYWLAHSKKLSL